MQIINQKQTDTLKSIIKTGKINVVEADLDLRTIRALERRGFAKLMENSRGTFVSPTSKGKKVLN